ncbi:helix-turn-helix domain-containing protein [Eubacterium sp.]|uniref:helix-turn-helix domain-containing protein n=1 Tax=Eubacterium sp. TaxID=142586 RepID=UPI003F11543B
MAKIKTQKLTLSVPEAAEIIGLSTARMYQVVRMEGFPAVHIGKRIFVSVKGLEQWIDKQAGVTEVLQ